MKVHNFCIIAHIDHGKSTLADRMLELTGTVAERQMQEQLLDSMDLEREKGITIKLQPVRMVWREHVLNLIDTPGHVDFQYEVSRSLQAVEGAVVLVDATQGIQAQTLANLYLAIEQGLEIIPVVNKIDLPAADVPGVRQELSALLGVEKESVLALSAKTGEGVEGVLDTVVERVPSAKQQTAAPFRALIFDSVYDDYKGVVGYIRVVDGSVRAGDRITLVGGGVSDRVVEAGVFAPAMAAQDVLSAGDIGYVATGLKDVGQARVGDTVALEQDKDKISALPGFAVPQAKVFAGLYPQKGEDFPELREALSKLRLNDASLSVQQESSGALGQGFRCGFLGMLHLEIVQERLRREYDLELVVTTPSVMYRVELTDGRDKDVHTPAEFPDPAQITSAQEQYAQAEVIVREQDLGSVFEVMKQHEGAFVRQEHVGQQRIVLEYVLPLRELVVDLYDHLKSATSGYGSLSYRLGEWRIADVVKLDILVNHELVPALSVIVPRNKAEGTGRRMVERLKAVIPRQLFPLPLQAAVGGSIVARETLPALRKDVTSGLYGGDVTRKRKLLEKQKKGKKRLATGGSVTIPPEAYIAVLKR